MARRHRYVIRLLVASAILSVLIIVLTLLKSVPSIAENVFTRGISRAYISAVGSISSLFPFSIFEILTGAAIVLLAVSLVKWIIYIKRKQYFRVAKGLSRMAVIILSVILVYTATASFSYTRADISGHIPMSSDKPEKDALMEMVDYFVDDFNALAERMPRDKDGNVVCPYTFDELAELMQNEFKRLDSNYFSAYTPRAKKIIAGDIMLSFGTLGISFQPTAEANINNRTVPIDLPELMAHELAHSKGVMRENDANLVAAYITLTSDNDYIRYSGYCNNYGRISQILTLNNIQDEYKAQYSLPSELINRDYKHRYEVYNAYPDFVDKVGEFFNNLYLKLSGVKEGTGSYDVKGNITQITPPGGGPVQIIVNYSTIQKMLIHLYKI